MLPLEIVRKKEGGIFDEASSRMWALRICTQVGTHLRITP